MARPARFLSDVPAVVAGVAIGLAAGAGIFTFVYAKGASYLSPDARACANCHIMRDQYEGWVRSTHHAAATCNDCHTPHDVVGKYTTKARNGFWHSLYFTTGDFHEPIRIKPHNRAIVERACRRCHQAVVHAIDPVGRGALSCVRCHAAVGHLP